MKVTQATRKTQIPRQTKSIGFNDSPHPLIVPEKISTQQYENRKALKRVLNFDID